MQINVNDNIPYDILNNNIEQDSANVNKSTKSDNISSEVDLNSAYKLDIKKSFLYPENRISDKVRELFDELVNGVSKTSGSYYVMESFKEYTGEYSSLKKNDPLEVSNTVSEIYKKVGLDLDNDIDKVITVGAEREEVIQREQDLKSKLIREKEIVRQIKKQFIDDVTPGVENYLKDIENKSKGIVKEFSELYERSEALGVDFKKESENFNKDSLKRFDGDFKKAQMVKQIDLGIEYI